MAAPTLELTSSTPEPVNNVFVHGFGRLTEKDHNWYRDRIGAIGLLGKTWLLSWDSGLWWRPFLPVAAAAGGLVGLALLHRYRRKKVNPDTIQPGILKSLTRALPVLPALPLAAGLEFWNSRKKAEALGASFQDLLTPIPDVRNNRLNLIGFSLGAHMLHIALDSQDWTGWKLGDVCLLGAATDITRPDWVKGLSCINGRLFNFYSEKDEALKAKPDRDKNAGHYPIPLKHPRIINIETGLHHQRHPSYGDHLHRLLVELRGKYDG